MLLVVAVLLGILVLLGRIQNGRYLRPVITFLSKVPLFKRWFQKASIAALERQNPDLAAAMKKMSQFGIVMPLRRPPSVRPRFVANLSTKVHSQCLKRRSGVWLSSGVETKNWACC